jgi:hypothetical protein
VIPKVKHRLAYLGHYAVADQPGVIVGSSLAAVPQRIVAAVIRDRLPFGKVLAPNPRNRLHPTGAGSARRTGESGCREWRPTIKELGSQSNLASPAGRIVWQAPENVSTWLGDWSMVTIIDNTMPPRDPNDDDDDAGDEDDDAESDGLMPSGP